MARITKIIITAAGAIALAGGALWYARANADPPPPFRLGAVTRGELLSTIGATGTVEPEETVDVGAQVAGLINVFGKDEEGKLIDYGSHVKEGMVLALIDDTLYKAAVDEANAQLAQNKASVQRSEADVGQMKAKLMQAQRDWDRAQKLGPSDALAPISYDGYESAYQIAKANVAVGEAAVAQAKGTVAQSEAALLRANRNLEYCTIKAPVDGVIIDRRVNIGQTVVSSLNAPSLFLIAKDLRKMQVWVSVNEADIGNIHPGQPVTFTVDAFSSRPFKGVVNKVRLNAAMTQNVVTYTVEVSTDNADEKLLPYLTANAKFEVQHDTDVLLVPNAALRWNPQPDQVAEGVHTPSPGEGGRRSGTLWVPEGTRVRPMQVHVGPSDAAVTEIEGEGVQEGLQVVIGDRPLEGARAPSNTTTNPFQPQMPFGGRQQRPRQQ